MWRLSPTGTCCGCSPRAGSAFARPTGGCSGWTPAPSPRSARSTTNQSSSAGTSRLAADGQPAAPGTPDGLPVLGFTVPGLTVLGFTVLGFPVLGLTVPGSRGRGTSESLSRVSSLIQLRKDGDPATNGVARISGSS